MPGLTQTRVRLTLSQKVKIIEESDNVQNEHNENDPEPEKVHSIAESLQSLSNICAHLMSLYRGI